MNQRVVEYNIGDIALDSDAISERLNKACTGRSQKYYVRGAMQIDETVYFILIEKPLHRDIEEYVLAPLDDISSEGLEGVLSQRWGAGFDAIAAINLGESSYIGLFAKSP